MPSRSKSQQRYFFSAAKRGEVSQKVANEFAVSGQQYANLPEHVQRRKLMAKRLRLHAS